MGGAADWRARFARRLLRWYRRCRRDLPWRRDPTPYRVWVSEVMLQQTQIDRVVPYFERFLERFPDVRSLAGAREDEVLALWSGLGYYGRGRKLHAAARTIVSEFGGRFPDDLDAAMSLPGVGRYTAGAVLSIAFNREVPVLDGNVQRVLCRVLAVGEDPTRAATRRRLWEEAASLIPPGSARDFNQALMELGALVCVPERPRCEACPVAGLCAARDRGEVDRFPVVSARRAPVPITLAVLVVRRGPEVLLTFTPADAPDAPTYLRGLWNFPLVEVAGGARKAPAIAEALRRRVEDGWGGTIRAGEELGRARHSITFRRITLRVWSGAVERAPAEPDGERWRWAAAAELDHGLAVPSLAWKAARVAGISAQAPGAGGR